jgi:hypothetical protein
MRTNLLFAFGLVASTASCASIIGIKDNPTNVIASGLDGPSSLVVINGNAYWVEGSTYNGYIQTAPVDGSGSARAAFSATTDTELSPLVTDGTSLCGGFSSLASAVSCIDLSTGNSTIEASSGSVPPGAPASASPGSLGGFAVHGGNVFWTQAAVDTSKTPSVSTEYLSMTSTSSHSSAAATSLFQSTSATASFRQVVADDTYVYFMNGTELDRVPWTGTINPKGSSFTMATGLSGVVSLAVDSSNVYLAVGSNISAVPLAGGSATTLVNDQEIDSYAVDGTFVYWTNAKAGTISKVSVNGGNTTLLANGQDNPTSIFVDSSALYWLNDAASSFGEYYGVALRAAK